tara:strand:+ start:1050 stop:2042 length:993 start_codon:yes stop_codon:yes gene_type:complete
MAATDKGQNPFETHFREKPFVLNTSFQKEEEFFAWTKDKTEARRRMVYLQELFNWVRDTYEPKGYKVEMKLALRTKEEFFEVNRGAQIDLRTIFILQFNFKTEWSVMLANMKAARSEKSWQTNAASMAGGWHLIVGDNYAEGGLSYSDEEMKQRWPLYKKAIAKAVGTVGKFSACAICFETVVGDMKYPCTVCNNGVCANCQNKILDKHKMFYKCPFCRNEVQPDSYVDNTPLKLSVAQLLTSEGSPARRQKVRGETDIDIATLLSLLRECAAERLGLYREGEAIVVEGIFQMPFTGRERKKIIIEVERAEERWDMVMKLLQGLCNGEHY